MIDFKKVKFIKSLTKGDESLDPPLKEIVVVGRSNVGKSSFLNAIVGQKIAYSSKKAGKTIFLNYFLVDNSFYLVDSPGYGGTSFGRKLDTSFSDLMEAYFNSNKRFGIILLADSRRLLQEEELDFIKLAKELNRPLALIYTKEDTLNQSLKVKATRSLAPFKDLPFAFSGSSKKNLNELRGLITTLLAKI